MGVFLDCIEAVFSQHVFIENFKSVKFFDRRVGSFWRADSFYFPVEPAEHSIEWLVPVQMRILLAV